MTRADVENAIVAWLVVQDGWVRDQILYNFMLTVGVRDINDGRTFVSQLLAKRRLLRRNTGRMRASGNPEREYRMTKGGGV